MIAVDTNILVYSHRRDSPWFQLADQHVRTLVQGAHPWALPWPCVHEFFGIVTHARVYAPPSTIDEAIGQIQVWLRSPSVVMLHETPMYWDHLRDQLRRGQIQGPRVHDAKVAALCTMYEVSELWSADRDFNRFPGLRVRNPLVS
ncbi:MAG: type II toxin-antitoxin system VapC family toxin [Chloroflexota bacterium]